MPPPPRSPTDARDSCLDAFARETTFRGPGTSRREDAAACARAVDLSWRVAEVATPGRRWKRRSTTDFGEFRVRYRTESRCAWFSPAPTALLRQTRRRAQAARSATARSVEVARAGKKIFGGRSEGEPPLLDLHCSTTLIGLGRGPFRVPAHSIAGLTLAVRWVCLIDLSATRGTGTDPVCS